MPLEKLPTALIIADRLERQADELRLQAEELRAAYSRTMGRKQHVEFMYGSTQRKARRKK